MQQLKIRKKVFTKVSF